ncbi:MAG: hypothetical protein AAB407_00260 [Patescibacteria group bacterium]
MKAGNVVIDPFDSRNLKTVSYDVTLGSYYFRAQKNEGGRRIFNPYNEDDVERIWGDPQEAQPLRKWLEKQRDIASLTGLKGIDPDTQVILIAPGEMLLCHTNEFIGGRRCVTTEMKARSSTGRVFLSVCKCAGWGDVGYFNRWTMEVTNSSSEYYIPLPVGCRFAQIAFFEVEAIPDDYAHDGKYQGSTDLEKLKADWKPSMMLPQMYRDREAQEADWQKLVQVVDTLCPQKPIRHGLAPTSDR